MESEIRRSHELLEEKVIERTAQLSASEERFRTTLDNLIEGCMIIDSRWTYVYVNNAIAAQTCRRKDDFIGRTIMEVEPDIRGSVQFENYRSTMVDRIPSEFVTEVSLPDGKTRWFDFHCIPVPEGIFVMSSDITERKQSEITLQQYTEKLRVLSQRLIEVQEAERRAIAFELHDEIGQVLTAIQFNLHWVNQYQGEESVPARMAECIAMTEQLLKQVRELSVDLRPWMLDQLGLVPSVRWYVDKQAQLGKFKAEFSAENISGRFPSVIEITVYRIIQETMTNILRHAHATEVTVRLQRIGDLLSAEIRDNGKGFNVDLLEENPIQKRGLGLIGMTERIASLGGTMVVSSSPGHGTTIRFQLALNGEFI